VETAQRCGIVTNAELARRLADLLDDCVIPSDNEKPLRLMLLHGLRVCGDPAFEEEARLLCQLLSGKG
jgi:hypothetical protein